MTDGSQLVTQFQNFVNGHDKKSIQQNRRLDNAESTWNTLSTACARLEARIDAVDRGPEGLTYQLREVKKDVTQLTEKSRDTQSRLDSLDRNPRGLTQQVKSTQEDLARFKEGFNVFTSDIKARDQKITDLERRYERLKTEIKNHESRLAKIDQDVKDIVRDIKSSQQDHRNDTEIKLALVEQQLADSKDLQKTMSDRQDSIGGEVSEFRVRFRLAEQESIRVKDRMDVLERHARKIDNASGRLGDRVAQVEQTSHQLDRRIRGLVRQTQYHGSCCTIL